MIRFDQQNKTLEERGKLPLKVDEKPAWPSEVPGPDGFSPAEIEILGQQADEEAEKKDGQSQPGH